MGLSQSFRYNSAILFKCQPGMSGLHFCITKKYGNAVQRNLLKRRIRNLYQELVNPNNPLYNNVLFITPLKQNISFLALQQAFSNLLKDYQKTSKQGEHTT